MRLETDRSSQPVSLEIQGVRLILARLAWGFTFSSTILLTIFALPGRSDVVRFGTLYESAYTFLSGILSYPAYLDYINVLGIVTVLAYLIVAVFIFWRKPSDWMAIMTSICLLGLPFVFFLSDSWNIVPSNAFDHLLQAANVFLIFFTLITLIGLMFYFPSGILVVPGPVRGLVLLFVLMLAAILAVLAGRAYIAPENPESPLLEISFGLSILTSLPVFGWGIFAQVYRYFRISKPTERQQTKWVIYGILLFLLWSVVGLLDLDAVLRFGARQIFSAIWIHVNFLFTLFFPFGLAISIFRYKLYEIDLIIRRTLQYGLLTGLLLILYYSLVLVLQVGVTSTTGEDDSPVVLVLSTLVIAAAFNPLRRRLQHIINRRFFRIAYDMEATLSDFANTTRNEVDMDRLVESLLVVVHNSVNPISSSIWIVSRQKGK